MRARRRALAIAVGIMLLVVALSLPASAAGPKRIFITKYDENFTGQAGVTFELYEDTDGDGVRDDGEPKLQTKVTDAAGNATFDPVDPGKYIVHEVTPAGYVDNPDQAVEIPNAKGKGPQIVFSNTPKPANTGVNDPTSDTSIDDGTHVFDFGPSIATTPDGSTVLIAYNHSAGFGTAGGVSGIETSLSSDGGMTWGPDTKVPPGSSSVFLLGQPNAAFDPVANQWIVAMDSVTNFGTVEFPIAIATRDEPGTVWNLPVTLLDTPASPAVSHGADVVVDPVTGHVHVFFIRSNADGTSQPMVSTSTDHAATFSAPNPIAGPGSHFDFIDGEMGPDGMVHLTWAELFTGSDRYNVLFDSTADPTAPWGSNQVIATDVPRSGSSGGCTSSTARSLFGHTVAFDAPKLAADPNDPNVIYAAFPQHGPAADESDVMFTRSTDGGLTWSTPLPVRTAEERIEFAPLITVSPDGRISTAYLDADPAGAGFDVGVVFYDSFTGAMEFGPSFAVTDQTSPFWATDPAFDTHYSNCFGLPPIGMIAPGSGFFLAWADGRDPGPAGNDGVDPNIYFARTEGPALSTTLTAAVDKTAGKIKADGALAPRPIPGAKVIVTLFQNTGDGFEQIGRKRPTTGAETGTWKTSFARPGAGKCRVVAEFRGAEGRAPSVPVTKTFSC